MAGIQEFEQEITKTRDMVEEMRTKIGQSSDVLDQLASTEKLLDVDFDIENARIQDVLSQQKMMEGNIAELILSLEDVTNSFGAEFKNMQTYTGMEKFIALFSQNKAKAMRNERVRTTSLGGNLQDLLSKSDTIIGILTNQKTVLETRYATSEQSLRTVLDRRQDATELLSNTQDRIEELNPLLMDLENEIAATTDQQTRTELEAKRSEMATEYNQAQAKEQELLATSQTLERYTSMFQTFIDSLNNQIAAQNTLINKLKIDTEQRIVLYKALEDSLKTAAQQDVAHKINTLGSKVDHAAEQTMAGIGAAAQSHIADLLEMHEQSMVDSAEIHRRKQLADDAFTRRFSEVMDKHENANYNAAS